MAPLTLIPLRLGAGAHFSALGLVVLLPRRGRRAHRVGIDNDDSADRAGNRRAGLVAIQAILSEVGCGPVRVMRGEPSSWLRL